MDDNTNANASESNNSFIILSDDKEKVSDSDSTDYEPETKKCKVDDDNDEVVGIPIRGATSSIHLAVGSGFQISITATSNNDVTGSQCISQENVLDDLHQSLEDDYPDERPGSPQDATRDYVVIAPGNSPSARGIRINDESNATRGGARRQRGNRNNRGDTTSTSPSAVRTSSSSLTSSEYYTDDIDLNDIPSDEYLSPPYASRQRRNAIFARREPPSSVQIEEDQYFHNELEVASNQDSNENPIEDGSSTSGTDYEVFTRSPVVPLPDPDPRVETDNNFADNENMRSDIDSEAVNLPKSSPKPQNVPAPEPETSGQDKEWLCIQCKANAMPYFNYCGRCFKIRRNWLPPRPASRRLKNRKTRLHNSNPSSLNNSRATKSSSEGEDVVDGARPCSSSQIQPTLPSSDPIDMNDGFLVDEENPSVSRLRSDSQPGNVTLLELFSAPAAASPTLNNTNPETNSSKSDSQSQSQSTSSSSQSQSQGSLFSANSQNSVPSINSSPTPQSRQSSSPLPKINLNDNTNASAALSSQCSICYVRSKDAAFVHNKIAHLYCCYTCADKILKKNGKCPICRERVLRVVKIISV